MALLLIAGCHALFFDPQPSPFSGAGRPSYDPPLNQVSNGPGSVGATGGGGYTYCPYPNEDYNGIGADSGTQYRLRELNQAVESLRQNWRTVGGGELVVLQAYRPAQYQLHLREVWDYYRLLNGMSPQDSRDYGCSGGRVFNYGAVNSLTAAQYSALQNEFQLHEFHANSFPVSCVSDHSGGYAVDIALKYVSTENLGSLVAWAKHVGLVRNIPGDSGHFVMTRYLR